MMMMFIDADAVYNDGVGVDGGGGGGCDNDGVVSHSKKTLSAVYSSLFVIAMCLDLRKNK